MLSVIAPAYNNADDVGRLLDSIRSGSATLHPFEVIIVDDGSKDDSIKDIVSRYDFARFVKVEKNSGAAVARNIGARESRYDALFFLDSDVVVLPDTLARAEKYFMDPDVKAFVGRLDMIPLNKGFFPRYKAIMFNSWLPKVNYSTVLSPAIGGVRKDIFFASGGFDEAIKGATVEYVKFSYELRKIAAIYFCPDVVVRVRLNSFRKALFTDFYSTMKWVTIFSKYKKLDNHCTSVSGGLGRIFGAISLVSLPVCAVSGMYLVWAAIFAAYLYLNRRFFLLVIRETRSAVFLARSVVTHLILSLVTVLGSISGVIVVIKNIILGR